MKCGHCGSARIVPRAAIMDRDDNLNTGLTAFVCAKPEAMIFRQTQYSRLFARICGDCGHTEVFAENASALYDAYVQSQQG